MGGPAIDDGVASEVGYYAALVEMGQRNPGRIFGLRTDFRCGENIAVSVNPQVLGYVLQTGGKVSDSMDGWFEAIRNFKAEL